jgi:RNAse (barnase) inhibitor barstar
MKTFLLDASRFSTRDGFYDEVSAVFGFPDYFGRNLDALADCLGDIEKPFRIVYEGAAKSETELGDFFFGVVEIFAETGHFERIEQNPNRLIFVWKNVL